MIAKKRSLLHWFKRKETSKEVQWTDPLDPHGDGTLRKGDPIFDAVMKGNGVMGNYGPNGWEFKEID